MAVPMWWNVRQTAFHNMSMQKLKNIYLEFHVTQINFSSKLYNTIKKNI